jgi:hypothetical protein
MRLKHRTLSDARGYAMVPVMLVLLAATMLAGAAYAAAGGDMPLARESQDRKQAYAAAEAGVEYYRFLLSRDNDLWTRCTDVPGPTATQASPINQRWNGSGADPRAWRRVADTEAAYTIELLPANGEPACDATRAEATMLENGSGTFRIRSTGRSRGEVRSVIATFRRSSFLDFLYFTDLETADPATYGTASSRSWAAANCAVARAARNASCTEIRFADADVIRGPFHTNDDLLTCGAPDLGRDSGDNIEISGPAANGYTPMCGPTSPDFIGTKVHPAPSLTLPATNASLETVATSDYRFSGATTIRLRDDTMDVTSGSATRTGVALPANGVIYVRNGACSGTETPLLQRYADPSGCATLTVSGRYTKSLTIASGADIVVDGDLTGGNDAVLGLIANNFVRVSHRVDRTNASDSDTCTNRAPVLTDVRIEAAILSLAHSFIVDNYACGARLGTLTVKGAIAQKFRGPVGTFPSAANPGGTGYTKAYEYDNRLKFRSPPSFLDPVAAAWRTIRFHEQVPATR